MQFKTEFIFKNVKGKTLYKGSDLNRLVMVVLSQVGFTEEQGVDIGDHIQKTWKEYAETIERRSHPWRATDYRADYLAGIKTWMRRGPDLVFALHGDKANAVEHGWAPPTSSEWGDGIGTYDGAVHDMRPWLLHSGHHMVRHAKKAKKKDTDASVYRYLTFNTPKLSEMLETTAQHQVQHEVMMKIAQEQEETSEAEQERLLQGARKALAKTARSSLHRDEMGRLQFKPLDLSDQKPEMNAYGEHYNWIYHSATMQGPQPFKTVRAAMKYAMHQAKFTVFRTIADSDAQIQRKLFFTRGIAPAKLISDSTSPVVEEAKKAVLNVMAGRNPDGSERNVS